MPENFKGALIGPRLAEDIRRTIATVDGTPAGGSRYRVETRFEDYGSPGRKVVRICTFTGPWAVNTSKTVTFKYQTTTPNTVSATNLFCGISPGSSAAECDVSIAKDGTAWFLLQPNLTQLPGYTPSGTHVLAVINGYLQFIGTTSCSAP